MHLKRAIAVGSIASFVVALFGVSTAVAKPDYTAYASCGTKPSAHVKHCRYTGDHPRATFVFQSNVGKRSLKVCQKITGLPFHGRQCLKAKQPLAYEAIPFHLSGAHGSFKVVVTFYVKAPGSGGSYKQAARVPLSFSQ